MPSNGKIEKFSIQAGSKLSFQLKNLFLVCSKYFNSHMNLFQRIDCILWIDMGLDLQNLGLFLEKKDLSVNCKKMLSFSPEMSLAYSGQ
jgi:hypothetical protein